MLTICEGEYTTSSLFAQWYTSFMNNIYDDVAQIWEFTEEKYPLLAKLSEDERKAFVFGHILKHFHKSLGSLEEVLEKYEHDPNNGLGDKEMVQKKVTKLFLNSVRLAQEVGVSPEDLEGASQKYLK